MRKRGVELGNNLDDYHLLTRRAFLTLVTMERWNAAGISAQTIIPEDLTKLVPADKILLGDLGYGALRKCSSCDYCIMEIDHAPLKLVADLLQELLLCWDMS